MLFGFSGGPSARAETSGDGYIDYDAGTRTWTLGTAAVEKKIQLNSSGQFQMTSFRNKLTNREYVQGAQYADEFQVKAGTVTYSGSSAGWVYDSHAVTGLAQGELELAVTFRNSALKVTRHYIVFPYTGAIQEWSVFQNVSGGGLSFSSPSIFNHRLMQNDLDNVDFQYMTGGGNFSGSGILKTVPLTADYARTFDSYDSPEVIAVDGQNHNGIGTYEQGTSVYDAFFVLRNRALSEGIWLSFDYNGHWRANVGNFGTRINLSGYVSMTDYQVEHNGTITGPRSIMGVYQGDLDDMGNTILDYTYRYLWDYTRGGGGGTWQWRVSPQAPFAFESVNYNRYTGGDIIHIDDNWYDRKGDWNEAVASDNFADLNAYVKKNGMTLKVWSPFWQADYGSEVVTNHPDWLVGGAQSQFYGLNLNMANEAAYAWMLNKANAKQAEWGTYQWRYDGMPASKSDGSDNDMLAQSNNFFRLLKAFKDANPEALIDGCSSGGETLFMGSVRFSDTHQLTDGLAGHYAGYYQSLKLPLDKVGHSFYSEPNTHSNFNSLEPPSPEVKENTRKFVDLNRYLGAQGLAGRWIKVYRPTMDHGDQTYMIQKMNADQTKGIIMFSAYTPFFNTNVTVYPKGLLDDTSYTVRCPKGSCAPQTESGAYWKANGISLTSLKAGELVLFNVTGYPGSGTDHIAPAAPPSAVKKTAVYMDRFGVELTWNEGTDNNWVSYYEIERNGVAIDKVSKGTFYFLPDGDIGDSYRIRTVDGDGNVSSYVGASLVPGGPAAPPAVEIPNYYQASHDFGSVQGEKGWSYLQQYAPSASWTNMKWDGANGLWQGNETYARISGNWMHPGNDYHAVRKWAAPKDGKILVKGSVSLAQANQGGDGVVVRIRKGGEYPYLSSDIWGPFTIPGTDTAGLSHHLTLDVKQGDVLYFTVEKNGNNYFDSTLWDPQIFFYL
ncbi:alpha-galactosidase [Paenibacillus sp. GCM10027626]|uniref:alpha-galactosidase n=1 Tax=Paenibacillus sp. GCM10027626 TaxID=3273411 RepID=UPI00362B2B8F